MEGRGDSPASKLRLICSNNVLGRSNVIRLVEEAAVTTDTVATKNIKVLMVDDHEIMRQAYGMLLNTDPRH